MIEDTVIHYKGFLATNNLLLSVIIVCIFLLLVCIVLLSYLVLKKKHEQKKDFEIISDLLFEIEKHFINAREFPSDNPMDTGWDNAYDEVTDFILEYMYKLPHRKENEVVTDNDEEVPFFKEDK